MAIIYNHEACTKSEIIQEVLQRRMNKRHRGSFPLYPRSFADPRIIADRSPSGSDIDLRVEFKDLTFASRVATPEFL